MLIPTLSHPPPLPPLHNHINNLLQTLRLLLDHHRRPERRRVDTTPDIDRLVQATGKDPGDASRVFHASWR